jgi:hypothetical protein
MLPRTISLVIQLEKTSNQKMDAIVHQNENGNLSRKWEEAGTSIIVLVIKVV